MNKYTAKTRILFLNMLRRDRLVWSLWIVAVVGFIAGLIPVFDNLLLVGEMDRLAMVEMMKNPAMIALVGPVYGEADYTLGAAFANYMLVFSLLIVGVMNIFLVTRHTRLEEDTGRMELLRALPVGRQANLMATALLTLSVNVLLAVILTVFLYLLRGQGMSLEGCALFGVSMGVIGIFFAATTAFLSQIASNNRSALSMSILLLLILYVMRAVGDVWHESLALISPLGLILRTKIFVQDSWWPVLPIVALSLVFAGLTLFLSDKRDMGSGLLPEKAGREHGATWLSGPFGLAFKLTKNTIILWGVVIFMLAAMYGSVFGELDAYLSSNATIQAMIAMDPRFTPVEQFMVLLMMVMSIISTVPILALVNRISHEEKNGFLELMLCQPVSKTSMISSYLVLTLVTSVCYQFIAAFGLWSVGSMVLETTPTLTSFIVSAFLYLPAIWVIAGMLIVIIGFLPGKSAIIYYYLGYAIVVNYIGRLIKMPEWTRKLTSYGYIPQYPLEEISLSVHVGLLALFVLLCAVGFYGFRKRDILTK